MAEVETASESAHDMERTDSMSSIDKELDLLMRGETDDTAADSQDGGQEELYLRAESRREEPSSQYPLNEESTEQHETAVENKEYEYETASDDELSEEQKLLEIELQKLKEEGFLPMDDPPEYDIANRVRELNEQLRTEGEIPERTDRKVTFSEQVIAVEFPEDSYEDDEDFETEPGVDDNTGSENVDSEAAPSSEVTDPNDLEVAKLTLEEKRKTSEIEIKGNENQGSLKSNGQSSRGPDEKILIERDGKFELINVKDLSYDERQSMGFEVLPDETDQHKQDPVSPNGHGDTPIPEVTTPQKTTNQLQPTPPSKPRPSTATDSTGLHRTQLPPRRIQSARTQRESRGQAAWSSVTYTGQSTYGLTPEQKEHKKEQLRLRMQSEQEARKATEEEHRKKQEEAESAFQAWLQNKEEAQKQRRQSEKEQKRHGGEKKDLSNTDEIYQDWLQMKQNQAKRERKLRKQAEQEKVNGFYIRDRKECDQAFKQWVRSKNYQLRRERSLKRSNATISRQLAQKSRKSKNLAKALETAQIYRYTDWYGYRF